jgi:hypothetical protein
MALQIIIVLHAMDLYYYSRTIVVLVAQVGITD